MGVKLGSDLDVQEVINVRFFIENTTLSRFLEHALRFYLRAWGCPGSEKVATRINETLHQN